MIFRNMTTEDNDAAIIFNNKFELIFLI